jgi:hypothetical protein
MKNKKQMPFQKVDIEYASYKLFSGFDNQGNPVLKEGTIYSENKLKTLHTILADAAKYKIQIAPTAIGEMSLKLQNDELLALQLIFDNSMNTYRNMFYYRGQLYEASDSFSIFLEQYRKN